MKILITSDLYKPLVNGVVTSIENLTQELEKLGHEVRILTLSNTRHSYKINNVYYLRSVSVRVYPDLRGTVYYRSRFLNEIIEWNPDIIHSQCEFFSFIFAEKIAEKNNIPIVHTYHTLYEQYADYIIKNRTISSKLIAHLSRIRLRNVQTIVCPTEKVKNSLKKYGVSNNVSVIPTGIDISKFKSVLSDEEKLILKQKYNIPLENKVLVNVGRVGFEKSLDKIVENFAQCLNTNKNKNTNTNTNLTLLIVGDGPAKESLVAMVQKLGIAENVVFTGMVKPNEVQKYYQLGDIFVCASTSETQGLTYIEAMSNGLPLVCQKDDCLEGVLFPDKNGLYFDTSDEFVSAVGKFIDDINLCQSAYAFNKNLINTFSKQTFAQNIEEMYNRTVEEYNQNVNFKITDIFVRN